VIATLCKSEKGMGVGNGEQEGRGPSWIFVHGTDILDRGLIVLFF